MSAQGETEPDAGDETAVAVSAATDGDRADDGEAAVGEDASVAEGAAEAGAADAEAEVDPALAAGGEVEATDARLADVVGAGSVRRAPRFGAFLAVGIVLALLAAIGLSFVRDAFLPAEQVQARSLDTWGTFWFLFILFTPAAALLSYGVVVVLDQRSVRRWRARRGRSSASDGSGPA